MKLGFETFIKKCEALLPGYDIINMFLDGDCLFTCLALF